MSKAIGTTEIDKSLEVEIAKSVHQSKRGAVVPRPASADHETTANKLGKLFRQITKSSIGEIDSLIDELHSLRKKLEADSALIEQAIARHSEHSQGVMQLTTIIADSVKRLPTPTPGQ